MSHPELTISGVLLPIRLGCSAEERLEPQPVEIDLTIRFETPPRGMVTDRLEDTVSYDALVRAIKEVASDREFSLIEHLANEIFTSLKNILGPEHELRVTVRKVSPPIPEIINVRVLDQGSSEMNIIVGVDESDMDTAVCAIYDAFNDWN